MGRQSGREGGSEEGREDLERKGARKEGGKIKERGR